MEPVDLGVERTPRQLVEAFAAADRPGRSAILNGLATRASTGDEKSLDALLQLVDHHGLARPAIRRLIISNDEVDDVHQDVLIAVARSVSGFRSEAAFTTWLNAVARNQAISHLRRRRATDPLDEDTMTESQRMSSLIASRDSLRQAVDELPDAYRSALVLRDVEQRSYAEIAERLDIALNTVKSRIARGRALLAGSPHFAAGLGDTDG